MSARSRITLRSLALASIVAALALRAGAQIPGPGAEPTLNDLALDWARGRFASPVICQIGERPVRGIRRVLIGPGPSHVMPPAGRIVFVDLEVSDATRCFTELSGDVPNVIGTLQIRLPATKPRDTVARDFQEQLRRKHGFTFEIESGGLKIQPVAKPAAPARGVDFRGGEAVLRELEPGTDSERLLAEFASPRKLLLELSARDGTKLSFPLYMTDLR